jgi:hypothetical protein
MARERFDDTVQFKVRVRRAKGPYRAVPRTDSEENERKLPRVPKSRRPVALKRRSRATKAGRYNGSGDEPVKFFGYEATDGVGPKDPAKNAVDMSGGDAESGVVMVSGNWFLRYSTDAGASFTTADPTTVFPKWAGHDFCCDQIVIYVPSIDRFVWFMQHDADSAGIGAFRLAVASPAEIKKDFQSAWTYWNFTAKDFGLSEDLDYPDLAYTKQFLHISTDATTTNGRLVVRVALSDLKAGGSLPGRHTHPEKSKSAVGAHLVQASDDGAFWVGSPDNSSLEVFSWPDSSTSYSWYTTAVAAYPNGTLSSKGPNGNDWLAWLGSGHVPGFHVCGAVRAGDVLWLAWTASSGSGTSGGPTFPNAHVRIATIDTTTKTVTSEQQVWNSAYAFAYPSLNVNSQGEIGIAVGVGGSKNNAHSSFGIIGDHSVWHVDEGDTTPARWGDYLTVRDNQRASNRFSGFGYYTTKDTTDTSKYDAHPFYLVYGRP